MPSRFGRSLLAAAGILAAASTFAGPSTAFVIVVNPSVQGTNVRRADLANVFLKTARWGDGTWAIPVDQSGASYVREAFSTSVLQMPVTAVVQYWQRQILTNGNARVPAVKSSEQDVLEFVAKTRGAVAYVSLGATLPPGVKTLDVID
jgi:hypothetical protein